MNSREIYNVALKFRKAIEDAIYSGDLSEVNLKSFPVGCCTYASDLLQRYFYDNGVETLYMSGRYGYGWAGESHAWLETLDETVIDITGDQYMHKELRFIEPVYVGPRNNGFHDKFDLDEPVAYAEIQDIKFKKRYNAVIRHMKL